MDFEKLEKLSYKYMGKKKSHLEREVGHTFYHCKRTSVSVLELRKKIFPEDTSMDDILRCAGMFHDIGKGIEPHSHSGAVLVRDLLKEELTPEELDKVCYLIEAHCDRQPETEKYDRYAKLLQDADLLDHLGGQGVWMTCVYRAFTNVGTMKDVAEYYLEEGLPEQKEFIHLLNFEYSRQVMQEKYDFEKMVAERFAIEAEGKYIV